MAVDQSTPSRTAPDALTLELYRKMLTVFYVEERLKIFVRQGKCPFHASTRGHEMLQTAMALLLEPGRDWFFTYYRSKALAMGIGLPLVDLFLAMLSREGDPNSNGRNMPEQFSSRELHLVAQTACTGTQYLPAVGAARAVARDAPGTIVYASSGEGATSEGEFFEALNWAARERLPVLFVVQNNGYAISVPQREQTASSIARIAQGFDVPAISVDGTAFDAIYRTVPPVIERVRQGGGPALVEASVVRLDPHSSSDDQRKYRSSRELETPRRAIPSSSPSATCSTTAPSTPPRWSRSGPRSKRRSTVPPTRPTRRHSPPPPICWRTFSRPTRRSGRSRRFLTRSRRNRSPSSTRSSTGCAKRWSATRRSSCGGRTSRTRREACLASPAA
ncbi:MAG TPA: thiamine pyrophosphate-dependent enzyme [Vicinamibacterales bacterium]|nr:thiamine pyrophosphate-dependent enzyme [Vicinamibacterales bacterium]